MQDCLDNFKDQNEFYYVSRDADDSEKGNNKRKDDKWWLPTAKVPPNGLSDMSRKFLQYQKDCVNQVLKAAMAINAQIISEMEIPEDYIESLPKVGKVNSVCNNFKMNLQSKLSFVCGFTEWKGKPRGFHLQKYNS